MFINWFIFKKNAACVQEILELILDLGEKYLDEDQRVAVGNILKKKLGLIINERFINIPPKIADPLFTSLLSEWNRVKEKNPAYAFDYMIMICKCYRPKGKKDGELTYANGEEEAFAKNAEIQFTFDVSKETDTGLGGKWLEGDVELVPHRSVLFFKAQKFPTIVEKVKELVG